MANYKVWLTVKDRYGATKEIDSGTISINQDKLTDEDLKEIKDSIPVYVPDVNNDILKYTLTRGETAEQLEFDIDKSNEWDATDNTSSSNYVWESMEDHDK